MSRILIALIRAYQLTFSAVLGQGCRYHPTCSHYAMQSVRRFGAARGVILGLSRIRRCHPWARGGHDPVPDSGTINMPDSGTINIPEKYPLNKDADYATNPAHPAK